MKTNLPAKIFKVSIIAFVLLFSVSVITNGGTYYSVATGVWSSSSTWASTRGGSGGAGVPGSSDLVYIESGYTVTVDISNAACQTLYIGGTAAGYGTGTLSFNAGELLAVSGAVTLGGTVNGTLDMTNGGILQFTGTLTVNTYTFTAGTGTIDYHGDAQAVVALSYYNLTLSGSGAATISGTSSTSIGGNLTLSGGSVSVTYSSPHSLDIGGNLTVGDGTTLYFNAGHHFTVAGTTTVGNGTSGTLSLNTPGYYQTFTGAVTIYSGGAITEISSSILSFGNNVTIYGTLAETTATPLSFGSNVTINGTGTLTEFGVATVGIAGSLTDNGTYTASTGIHTFSGSNQTISGTSAISIPSVTVSGSYTNSGTLTVGTALVGTGGLTQGATGVLNIGGTSTITTFVATATGNTVNYTGTAQTVMPVNYYNLGLGGSATKTLSASITSIGGNLTFSGTASATALVGMTIGGYVTLGSGTTFVGGAFTHNVGGNWINNGGTFTNAGTTINFNGSSQSIGGTSSTTFNTVIIAAGSTTTLGIGTTIKGLTINGTLNDGGFTIAPATGSSLTMGAAGIYNLGSATVSTTWPAWGTLSLATGSTIGYVSSVNQTVSASPSYQNLTFGGAATKTLAAAITVNGTLAINSGIIANLGTYTSNANTLTLGGAGQPSGSYGGTGSIATYIIPQFFAAATGILDVNNNSGTIGTWLGGQSIDWFTTSNWYGGVLPTSAINVIIQSFVPYQPTIGAVGAVCNNMTINSGSVTTIASGANLTVNGTTTLGGTNCLVIQSNSTGTGSFIDNGITGSGTAEVQVYLSNTSLTYDWHYLCIPIQPPVDDWTYHHLYMKWYDESGLSSDPTDYPAHQWKYVVDLTHDSTLTNTGLGYAMWVTSTTTVNQNGTPNTGTITIPTTSTAYPPQSQYTYDGWNLIGNPYPSSIDLSSPGITWTNVTATAWFWNPSNGNYYAYPTGGYGTHDQYCPPEQGFFVHNSPDGSSGSVSVSNSARLHTTEPFLKRSDDLQNLLSIKAEGTINSYQDELIVYFNEARTNQYQPGFDAEKLFGDITAPQIYTTKAGYDLTVNGLPFSQSEIIVPMAFKDSLADTYTLTASGFDSFQSNVSIKLEDQKKEIIQDLRANPVYSFTHVSSDDPNRFLLHFNSPNFGINDQKNVRPVDIYSYGQSIYITAVNGKNLAGKVYVYDLPGQELYQQTLPDQQMMKINFNLTEGYYIVKVVTDQGVYTDKVYLK
jgi:hypothetical protein